MISWTPDYLDPHSNADTFAHNDDDSDEAKSHPLAWRNHWYIPDITAKMKAAAQEVDTAKRKAEYEALQKQVTDDGPFILMFQPANQVASRVNVQWLQARHHRRPLLLPDDHQVMIRRP